MNEEAPPIDEVTPSVDFLDQLRTAGDAAMPALLRRLHTAVEGGGKVTVRHACSACGTRDNVDIEVADVEEVRKLVEMFANLRLRAQQAAKGDDASAAATKLLRDRSELTDAELSEYIVKLETELA